MAWSRFFSVLGALTLLAIPPWLVAAEPALTAEGIIAKAQAAVCTEPGKLAAVTALRLEFTASDEKGKALNTTTLTLAAGGYRLQTTADRDRGFEAAICAGRLEGWTSNKADALSRRSLRALPYTDFKMLKEMSRDDLAFFAAPTAGGAVSYQGPSEIAGRKTEAVVYRYESGFQITRHFDATTFALVASDQLTPKGELQRQQVVSFTRVNGISFPAKEIVFMAGRQSGEVTYDQITVNPTLPAGLFDFPSF